MRDLYIADRVAWANGRVARAIGGSADAYRPSGNFHPLSTGNRFLRLPAKFAALDGTLSRNHTYGEAAYGGYFDLSYTQPGDYLVQGERTWFIAAQEALGAATCILTNHIVGLARPELSASLGGTHYANGSTEPSTEYASQWPASILATGRDSAVSLGLPTDILGTISTILLPASMTLTIRPTDIVTDDLARVHIVSGCEKSALGWRLIARLVTP